MTLDQAKSMEMPCGMHKGITLSSIPYPYLKWLAKNWVRRELREAALVVLNARSKDVGETLTFKLNPTPKITSTPKVPRPRISFEVSESAFGELREILQNSPEGLF